MLSTAGRPVAHALVDFWQADASGAYDNSGYKFRGHQFTDAKGRYALTTVVPGLYPGRTKHIHVKAQAPSKPTLTTQLYFPGVARNRTDNLYRRGSPRAELAKGRSEARRAVRLRPRPGLSVGRSHPRLSVFCFPSRCTPDKEPQ